MDIDRFLSANQPVWERLAQRTRRASRGVSGLPAAEIDELVRLYQRASSHLSYVRTYYRDPALVIHLTGLVAAAGSVVYGTKPKSMRAVSRFFRLTFPAALWHSRWYVLVSAALFLAPAVAIGAWLANSDAAIEASAPPALRQAYIEEDFEAYYSSEPASQFAAGVTTNNIQVGFLAFAGGVLLCIPTALLLVYNGANLGVHAGLFLNAGEGPRFFGLILPHGLLEITAILVAGGAGLRLGWALVHPGDRPRRTALTEEGRRSVVLVIGLVATFSVAGLIEGFVTGSPLPTSARVGVGVAVEVAFLLYAVVLGREAVAKGLTGLLDERPAVAPGPPHHGAA